MAEPFYQRRSKDKTSHKDTIQRQAGRVLEDNRQEPIQKNNTGLPDNLKSGMENLSGMNLNHVNVHYNSSKPAAVQAHAYAQGGDIHLAPGQERHLPHELGHVVQQMQGRVKPTMSMGGVAINDNPGLEHEATLMGDRAMQRAALGSRDPVRETVQAYMKAGPAASEKLGGNGTAQFHSMDNLGMTGVDYAVMSRASYGQWQNTVQAKSQTTGVCHQGDQVVITQFRNPQEVMQQAGFLGPKVKGALIIGEGILTLAAGIAMITVSSGVALIPGISSVVVGIAKIVRGSLSIYNGVQSDKAATAISPDAQARIKEQNAKRTHVMDILRGIEAVAATVGAAAMVNPAGLVFGLAKMIRSLLTALANYLNKDKHPNAIAGMKKIAAAMHVLEVFAGGFSGVSGIAKGAGDSVQSGVKLGASIAGTTVAGSKAVRATDQVKDSF